MATAFHRILKEPPLRLLVKQLVKTFPFSIEAKAAWDANPRPAYAVGVLPATYGAVRRGIPGGFGDRVRRSQRSGSHLPCRKLPLQSKKKQTSAYSCTVSTPAAACPRPRATLETIRSAGRLVLIRWGTR